MKWSSEMVAEKVPIVRTSSLASVCHSSESPTSAIYTANWAQKNAASAQSIAISALSSADIDIKSTKQKQLLQQQPLSGRAGAPSSGAYRLLADDRKIAVVHKQVVPGKNVIRRGFSDDVGNIQTSPRIIRQTSQRVNSARAGTCATEFGHVYLNIYDLEAVNKVINVVAGTFGAGAYHAGVEIYGAEYNFGYTRNGGSGVVQSYPRCHPSHVYRKTIDLGKTPLTPKQVLALVETVKPLWPGASYDILKRNCLNFADDFCHRLQVGGIPSWVMGLQNKINWTRDSFNSGAAKLKVSPIAIRVTSFRNLMKRWGLPELLELYNVN
ncbi:bifunctional PPPDE peptidase domain/PPPDE peptidase domain superfamily [Babesia duncani]|uniref:Bifunctional PPPDE peptidase domain/PPPDE peptidase domain superfamily n=1 Tax=Babesia duncani TaxID=323732 RepID=A0AAD9PHU6_9APIC|nr:bifunctional PPPDE peptidase domain/PPPDE peptidase domain superfamily [Babesia duncani]KAK2198138.1 bifunctional PPPDE peptidase domain/PPPDE peptidase domain superfamily [Babesia duncani]